MSHLDNNDVRPSLSSRMLTTVTDISTMAAFVTFVSALLLAAFFLAVLASAMHEHLYAKAGHARRKPAPGLRVCIVHSQFHGWAVK